MNIDHPPENDVLSAPPEAEHSLADHVFHLLATQIEAGEFQVGQFLPSKRDLAAKFGFSTNPVHRALSKLEEQGYVCRIHGSGVRVQSLGPAQRSNRRFPIIDFIAANPNLQFATVPDKKNQHIHVAVEDWLWWHLSRAPGIRGTLSNLESITDKAFIAKLREVEELKPSALVFCMPEEFSDEAAAILHRIKSRGTRVVYYATRREESGIDRVYSDFVSGQYELTRYLLKKGYRRILRFSAGRQHLFEKLKQEGFLRALREAGFTERDAEEWTLPVQHMDAPDTYASELKRMNPSGEPIGIMANCDGHVLYLRIAVKQLKWTHAEVTGYDANWSETNFSSHFLFRDWATRHPELAGLDNPPASVDTQLPIVGAALAEIVLGRVNNTLPTEPQVRCIAQKLSLPKP